MMLIRFKGCSEQDALTKARRAYCYTHRAGVCRRAKTRYNRRLRRVLRILDRKGDR